MKSKIVIMIMLFLMVLALKNNEVYAEDSADDTSITYTVNFFLHGTYNGKYYCSYNSSGEITVTGIRLVGYVSSSTDSYGERYMYHFYSYNSSGYELYNAFSANGTGTYVYGKCYDNGVWDYGTNNNNDSFNYHEGTGLISPAYMYKYVNNSWEYITTSIPIFSSEEEALAFINGDLTEKDAMNYESDLCKIVYDLETPQELKAVKDNGLIDGSLRFTWTQTDPNYELWETEFYMFEDFRYRDSFLIFSFADWKYVEDHYLFVEYVPTKKLLWRVTEETHEKHKCEEKRIEDYPTDYGGLYEPILDKYYIRNHFFDGEMHHYSNWVVVTMDYETGEVNTTVIEREGSEVITDDTGKVTIEESDINNESQYIGDDYDILTEESSSDIVNFIEDGFGFLGENGIIQMMKDAFSYLPGEIWVIVYAGFALFVMVAVVKIVF